MQNCKFDQGKCHKRCDRGEKYGKAFFAKTFGDKHLKIIYIKVGFGVSSFFFCETRGKDKLNERMCRTSVN